MDGVTKGAILAFVLVIGVQVSCALANNHGELFVKIARFFTRKLMRLRPFQIAGWVAVGAIALLQKDD